MAFRKFALILPAAALIAGCQSDNKTAATGREQELEQRVQTLERQLLEAQSPSPDASPSAKADGSAVQSAPATAPVPVVRTQTQRTASSSSSRASTSSSRASTSGRTASAREDVSTTPAGRERYERIPSAEPVGEEGDDEGYSEGRPQAVEPRATTMVLPEGTELHLVLEEPLSSATSHAGDRVTARVERAVSEDGRIVLPGGTVLQGRVTDARSSGRVSGRARVAVDFDRIVVRGRTHELEATSIVAEAPSESGRDAKVVGGSAVAGAILGAIADGKEGAVRGAVVGAGAGGAAVLIGKGREIEMPSGSRWTVRVKNPVRL